MISEKIEQPEPVDPPVATLTVTQKELDLLTSLINEVHTKTEGVDVYQMYNALSSAGGSTTKWAMKRNEMTTDFHVAFVPVYKG